MNINEIERLVALIEKTVDTETKGSLKRLLATIVEKEGALPNPWDNTPSITLTAPSLNVCAECGIDLNWAAPCMNDRCPKNWESFVSISPNFSSNVNITGC